MSISKVYLLESQDDCYESPSLLGIFESKDKVVEVMQSLQIKNIEKLDGFYYADDERFYNVYKVPFNKYVEYCMTMEDDCEVTDLEL